MANNSKTSNPDIFDIKRIEQLIDLMSSHDLSEIVLQQGDVHIELKRSVPSVLGSSSFPQPVCPTPVTAAAPTPPPENNTKSDNKVDEEKSHYIKSPMVGTFYAAASPGAAELVKVGDYVTQDKTVCLIEAMKVYNDIQAECSGKIIEVLVRNGEAVEFGKPLFRVAIA
ncbi:MAG: acetyl-CoA carboxylase biotin carboxyl carrier protein [Planctomycetaceae bacterium]|jgi:acetyl-CoA carboxylase biotin carboxyl carrier protein|nr:acetyl-CoA carboxylase biotin carboxyl carrier protein [Planctomycetaceae bacterium]